MKAISPRFLILAIAALLGPSTALAADIVGTWKWSLPPTESAPIVVTLVIQPGEGAYAATYTETGKDPVPVTVKLSGDSVTFAVEGSSLGKAQYIGRHEDDVIDGLITVLQSAEEIGEGLSWRATRVQAETRAPTL